MIQAKLTFNGSKYQITINGKKANSSEDKVRAIKVYEKYFFGTKLAKNLGLDYLPELIDETGEESNDSVTASSAPKMEIQSKFSINDRFGFMESMLGMTIEKITYSMIITGEGGLGKSFTVHKMLVESGLREDIDYKIIKGMTTPKALYRLMHDYRDKLLVFDDCDSVFKDLQSANLLKAALDDKKHRKISWLSERNDEELESQFEFTGQVIFISNIPQEKFSQALKSRAMMVDLSMTTEDKLERMETILPEMAPDFDMATKKEAFDFLISKSSEVNDLNFRTLEKIIKIRAGAGDRWKDMAEYMTIGG